MERDTVRVYETRADDWARERGPGPLDTLDRLVERARPGWRADLGCGPGWHLGNLGHRTLALDASEAMVRLARESAPDAGGFVVGDLEALPLRRGSIPMAWAAKSYHHLRSTRLPMSLADLHRAVPVGGLVGLRMQHGEIEGTEGGDFPGRYFATSTVERLCDIVEGAGFDTIDAFVRTDDPDWIDLLARRCRTLADHVDADMRVLLVGLNPSLHAADAGVGFAGPSNRFWPAALAAGLVSRDRDPRHALEHHRVGMTDLVKRASRRAADISADEYRAGATRVERLVRWLAPDAVCFVGLSGYRLVANRSATAGWQTAMFGDRPTYVMPNPSGLNAHASVADLRAHLRAVSRI